MLTITDLQRLYEIDDYQWLEKTVKRLKNKQFHDLDLDNLIEELEDFEKKKKNAVASLFRSNYASFS